MCPHGAIRAMSTHQIPFSTDGMSVSFLAFVTEVYPSFGAFIFDFVSLYLCATYPNRDKDSVRMHRADEGFVVCI